jgi:hypothetical protein
VVDNVLSPDLTLQNGHAIGYLTSLVNVATFHRDAAFVLLALSPDRTLQSGHTISYVLGDVVSSQRDRWTSHSFSSASLQYLMAVV